IFGVNGRLQGPGSELLLPVLGSLPAMLEPGRRLARADVAYSAGELEPLLPARRYRNPLRRHSFKTPVHTPRQYVDLEPGFVLSGSPFVNQFQTNWMRSPPAQSPTPDNGVLPGAIIIDVRHGILLPEGRSREELEPVISDSYRILEHYLHSNDSHESRNKILKARRRRSAFQRHLQRTHSTPINFAVKKNDKLNAAGPLPSAYRPVGSVSAPEAAEIVLPLKPEMDTSKRTISTTQSETTTTGTTVSVIPSTSKSVTEAANVTARDLRMHPELRKFLVEGRVNGTQSDLFVLKEKVDPEQVRPFRLVKVNSTNHTDIYQGTGLKTIGRYWLLSPKSSNRRARRSVPPYYAVNSFAMNPSYNMDKNKTYYTVFAKVSEAVLQDFLAQNANQRKIHESGDMTNMYSGDLFNYVVDSTGKQANHQPVREHKGGESMEDAFHQVYKDIKKNDELKFGTMPPPGLEDEKVEVAAHVDISKGNADIHAVDDALEAEQKAGLKKRSHLYYGQGNVAEAFAEPHDNEHDHNHGHEHDHDHDQEAPPVPSPPQTNQEHHDTHEDASAAAALNAAQLYPVEVKHTLREKLSLDQAPRGFSPEFVANLKRLTALGYIHDAALSGKASLVDQETRGPEMSRDAAVMRLDDDPYASIQSREELSPPTRDYRAPEANPFDHFGMAYHPLKGRKLNPSFFESLLPEAVIVPDPNKDYMDSMSDYPVAVLYRIPRDRLPRSGMPRLGYDRAPLDARYRNARYQGPALALQRRARWFSGRDKEYVTPSTTKDNIKCIYRKNSVVCYQSR
ncbi:unnamed protein product, partial [Ixodes persulcatus]